MTGFLGQKFDFTGEDGQWYCLISDFPDLHMNMVRNEHGKTRHVVVPKNT